MVLPCFFFACLFLTIISWPSLKYLFIYHVKTMVYEYSTHSVSVYHEWYYLLILSVYHGIITVFLFIYLVRTWEDRAKKTFSVLWLVYRIIKKVKSSPSKFFWVMLNCPGHSCLSFSFFLALSRWVPVKHQLSLGLRLSLPVSTPKNSSVHALRLPLSYCFHFLPLILSLGPVHRTFSRQNTCLLTKTKIKT